MEVKWIPCSDRLPSKDECIKEHAYFLVTSTDGFVYEATYNRIKKEWYSNFDNRLITVLAWMPLPEPYKGY